MHIKYVGLILLSNWLLLTCAQPSRPYRLAYFNAPKKIKAIDNIDDFISESFEDEDDFDADYAAATSRKSSEVATGRLFFKNLFNRQPIIPIIITGTGAGTGTTTGTIPTATGTVTTTPVANRGYSETEERDEEDEMNNENTDNEDAIIKKQQLALQSALAAAAQEYVVTNDKNDPNDPGSVNLRQKGTGSGKKNVSVNIPAKYRKYFKSGQRVYLRRPNNRRRRNNRNRRRKIRN